MNPSRIPGGPLSDQPLTAGQPGADPPDDAGGTDVELERMSDQPSHLGMRRSRQGDVSHAPGRSRSLATAKKMDRSRSGGRPMAAHERAAAGSGHASGHLVPVGELLPQAPPDGGGLHPKPGAHRTGPRNR